MYKPGLLNKMPYQLFAHEDAYFFKRAQAGGQTWDLFGFHLFPLSKAVPQTTRQMRPHEDT